MSHAMPLEYITKAVQQSLSGEIEAAVEKALVDAVMPRIKQIASDTAMSILRNASTHVQRDLAKREINLMVMFDREVFAKDQS